MSEIKKKTYTKKPSKKERLAAELAQKQAKQQEEARLKSGGTFVRADGVVMQPRWNGLKRAAVAQLVDLVTRIAADGAGAPRREQRG